MGGQRRRLRGEPSGLENLAIESESLVRTPIADREIYSARLRVAQLGIAV
jgi:hypothetical protein